MKSIYSLPTIIEILRPNLSENWPNITTPITEPPKNNAWRKPTTHFSSNKSHYKKKSKTRIKTTFAIYEVFRESGFNFNINIIIMYTVYITN